MAKKTKESKLIKIMKSPIRALIMIKDLYVKSMTECSGHFEGGAATLGCPVAPVTSLPRSFSSASTNSRSRTEDYRELIKVASTRSLSGKIDQLDDHNNIVKKSQLSPVNSKLARPNGLMKSQSAGIFTRIDEDKPSEFDDGDVKLSADVYSRSKSYAVPRRKMV